jgi:hypothetical protein
MDSLRKIEEDLRNFSVEFAPKKYPEVAEACERAIMTLKTMREMYVADKMRKTGLDKEDVKIPQSSDISAPYLLACNYVDAPPKLILMALNGIQLIVNFEVIPLSDVKSVLRVFTMQAGTGKLELQLKILQILGQLVTLASRSQESFHQHFNESTIKVFLALTLGMCGSHMTSLSVSTTALATSRQIIAILMDGITFSLSSVAHLIEDLCLYIDGKPGDWNKGLNVKSNYAFDVLDFMLSGWKQLFSTHVKLLELTKTHVFGALKPQLQNMQSNFSNDVMNHGVTYAAAQCYKVVRLARCFLLDFAHEDFVEELDIIITLMIHSLTSDHTSLDGGDGGLDVDEVSGNSFIGAGAALLGGITGGFQGSLQRLTGNSLGSSRGEGGGVSAGMGGMGKSKSLRSCYLVLSSSDTFSDGPSSPASPPDHIDSSNLKILSHPAGLCLEALLSFFLGDIFSFVNLKDGNSLLVSSMINTAVSASTVLSKALSLQQNVNELNSYLERGPPIVTVLEDALSKMELSVDTVIQNMNEHLGSSSGERVVSNEDVMVLAMYVLQVLSRRLAESTIDTAIFEEPKINNSSTGALFVVGHPASPKSDAPSQERRGSDTFKDLVLAPQQLISEAMNQVCVGIYESVQDACMRTLSTLDNKGIVRRCVGILSEVAIVAGVLGHQRPCEVIISSLCRFTVPKWHGYDSITDEFSPDYLKSNATEPDREVFRWRHVQATVRLLQSLHVLADKLSDWDSVVDALEQIVKCLISPNITVSDEVTSADIEKILAAINRFKEYSVHLSDDSLIKLMSSLVAMSLNTLAVTAKSSSSNGIIDRPDMLRGVGGKDFGTTSPAKKNSVFLNVPTYMMDGMNSGLVSFSLQTAIQVSKANSFRVACIWQMVTSHLRMIASLKSEVVRAVSVHATHDMILSVLRYIHMPQPPLIEAIAASKAFVKINYESAALPSSDELLFNAVIPSLQTCFLSRQMHKHIFKARSEARENEDNRPIELSQNDVLNCLLILSSVRCDDVKVEIMQGLLGLLQGNGDVLNENGWKSVVNIISVAPQSLCGPDARDSQESLSDSAEQEDNQWPRDALETAFTSMKLVVDEYIEVVSISSVSTVIECCAAFSAQPVDVNISLTALEMLWKVYDQMMRTKKGEHDVEKKDIFDLTMRKLLALSTDSRPEIRNCATNTLFAALTLTSNASLTSGGQWRQIFDQVIFPLFEMTGERSHKAMQSNEEAIAPELKKGTKMILHHSRDTAHKQWSETRLLALRGLTRVINTCTSSLITESWFRQAWMKALNICKWGSHSSVADMEVAIGSVDVMFAMLKMVSVSGSTQNTSTSALALAKCQKEMWSHTWTAISDVCKYDFQAPELALHLSQSLQAIYGTPEGATELQKAQNLSTLCLSIITLVRPRLEMAPDSDIPKAGNSADQLLLMRSVLEFIEALKFNDNQSRSLLSSTMVQLCFSGQYAQCISPVTGQMALLDSCPHKFREDVARHFVGKFLGSTAANQSPTKRLELIDTVFGHFIGNVCGPAIAMRSDAITKEADERDDKDIEQIAEEPSSSKRLGFFSFLSGPLDEEFGSDQEENIAPSNTDISSGTLHNPLSAFTFPKENESKRYWTAFYNTDVEIKVMTQTIEEALANDNLPLLLAQAESTAENIFSSLLCVLSPWKVSELPGAGLNRSGSFAEMAGNLCPSLCELLDAIFSKCDLDGVRAKAWARSLIEVIFVAMRIQVLAMADEKIGDLDFDPLASLWRKTANILGKLASIRRSATIRRKAVTAMLELAKDFSLLSLNIPDNDALAIGSEIFLGKLIEVKASVHEMPKSFDAKLPSELSLLQGFITSLSYDNSSVVDSESLASIGDGALSERAHLMVFSPVAFQASKSTRPEISRLCDHIAMSVDIASLINSYTTLLHDRSDKKHIETSSFNERI